MAIFLFMVMIVNLITGPDRYTDFAQEKDQNDLLKL